MRITSFAVNRRLATSAIVVALAVLGIYGFMRLPVDFLPGITYPLVKVHIWWRGATPEEIEKSVAEPIERQMATIEGVDNLESSSIEGMYTLQVNFLYGTGIEAAFQDVLAAMARVARDLPPDMDPPVVIKADPSQLPVMQLTASSERWDLVRLRDWADNWLQDQLTAVRGVAGAEIVGGLKREIRVLLDPSAMEKHSLDLDTVVSRLAAENVERFGGRVTAGAREFIVRTTGEYRALDDIRGVVIAREGPSKLYLRDIAEVVDSHEDVRVITRLDGRPCVKLSVLKQADANTVEVADAVARRLAELGPVLPPEVELGVVENQAEYVRDALSGVRIAAVQAGVLLMVIVFLFLGSVRQVLVMVIALPLTLILNFGLMKIAGFSLNIFSLGGLVIAIGVVLDNSIVVLENMTRLRRERPLEDPGPQAVEAVAEVGPAVTAATLSFLALFVPFLIVPGMTSLLFRELILVIAGIVVISLVVAVSVTPMVTATLFSARRRRATRRFELFFERFTGSYERLLARAMPRRRLVVALSLAAVVLAGVLLGRLGGEFLPAMDDGRIMVKVRMPTGASIAETDAVLRRAEEAIGEDELIESVFTMSGGRVWGLYTYEIANEGEINIQLVPRADRGPSTEEYIRRLRRAISPIGVPGGNLMVSQLRVKGIRKLGDADIEVKIRGEDMGTLFDLARRTAGAMSALDHFENVYVSIDLTKPEYRVQVDRAKAAELGVPVVDMARSLNSLITGAVATRYRNGDEYYNVRVLVPQERLTDRAAVENLPLAAAGGAVVRVRDVAAVEQAVGPVEINREDQIRQVVVRGDAAGASVAAALRELKGSLEQVDLPVGYAMSFGGQAQMMAEMTRNILAVLAFAVFFSFIVLAVQFDSLSLPAMILGSLPVCLAGLVFMLFLTGMPLGATVIIGALVVVAATVNDGVLLLTFTRELRERQGLPPARAVAEAARIRLRPRLMTTLTTIAGFLPLALNLGGGNNMLQPMALGAVGGLIVEMLVALLVMPSLYLMMQRRPPSSSSRSYTSST